MMGKLNPLDKEKFWNGSKNKSIRYYFYTQRGLALLNEFRYLAMGIFALYFALEVDNILLIPIMFAVSIPALVILGWLSVHHIDKVVEFLQTQYATHFNRYNIELQEQQLEELRKANKLLGDDLEKCAD